MNLKKVSNSNRKAINDLIITSSIAGDVSYPARLPGGEVGDGLNNRYDMILLIKSGPCVTDPSALISGRNPFSLIRPYNMLG